MFMLPALDGWEQYSLCRGIDPVMFFPRRGQSPNQAKEVCFACPVRYACLHTHLREEIGVWGGMSERERRKYRKYLKEYARDRLEVVRQKELTQVASG